MGKRRSGGSRQAGGFWQQEYGGMPMWGIVGSLILVGAIVVGVLVARPADVNAGTQRELIPVPTFSLGTDASPEAASPPEFPRQADDAIGAVFLGDSLTYGLYASSEDAGYRPQVVSALSSIAPVNATRGGQTGNTVATVSASATIPEDTGLVVLALGTNDVWNTPVTDFAAQYQGLVSKVRESSPNAELVCLSVWANPDGARNYNPPISSACEAAGGTYVLISDLFDAEGTRGPSGVEAFGGVSDDFHPNDTGYAAIAQRVKEALQLQ